MASYEFLAGSYDQLTQDVGYVAWADYLEAHFATAKRQIHSVLDLACGTGSLTLSLANRGYDMTGVDLSGDMLAQAIDKCAQIEGEPPLFLNQSMDELDLYDTVDACVCCLDSVNYVTEPEELATAFRRVHLFLNSGGLFIFDINSPAKLMGLDGQVFLDEDDDTYCVWRAEYDPEERICTYCMDIFRRDGAVWHRGEELHEEYAYTPEELLGFLQEVGFTQIALYGDKSMTPPQDGEERIFFVARKD